MNIIEALTAFAGAAEHEAEEKAMDLVQALEGRLAGLVQGLEIRVADLETKLGTDAANGLASLGDRVGALEKAAGMNIDDGAVASAIASLTAPPPAAAAAAQTSSNAAQAVPTAAAADPTPATDQPAPAAA